MAVCMARIQFIPKKTSAEFCLDKIDIISTTGNWLSLDDYITDGYIATSRYDSYSELNANCSVKLRAKTGYKISACYKTNSSGTSNRGDFEIDANGYVTVNPWETGTATTIYNYLYISVVEDSGKYHVTNNLENCTSDGQLDYTGGENVNITLSCNTGYKFDTVPMLDMGGTSYPFTVSADRATATLNFTVSDDMTITGTGTLYNALTLVLEHVTSNITSEVKHGVNRFILSADSGYCFNDNVTLFDKGTGITSIINTFQEGNTKCIFSHEVQGDITIEATAIKQVEKISSFANLYSVDNDVLDALSKARFFQFSGQSDVSAYDYGQFITSLYKIPFALDESMIADKGNIQLGEYDSKVQADRIQDYILYVNMGTIQIPEKYHNAYDYKDSVCYLHIPYCDTIQLENFYVINHVIKLEYKIDLYSGECTVNISSDITDGIIASKSFTIGSQIPFMQMQTGGISNQIKQVLDNGVITPYIEVVRNIPYNINTMFGRETVDYGKLENYRGFIKVSDIMLNISAKNDEKSEIISLLRNGVYINEKK